MAISTCTFKWQIVKSKHAILFALRYFLENESVINLTINQVMLVDVVKDD